MIPLKGSTCNTSPLGAQSEVSDEPPVAGRVWELSQDPAGCRRVQKALEMAASEEERVAIAQELHGHVLKAMRCPHANYVLQKCINTMQPRSLQFIIHALMEQERFAIQASKHKYGCRIIQQLFRVCPPSQVRGIAKVVLEGASTLACHTFGNFVVRQLMEFGTKEQQHQIARCVEENARIISKSHSGGGVIEAAITHATSQDRARVARAIAQDPKTLLALAAAKHGGPASVARVLRTLEGQDRKSACAGLAQHLESHEGRDSEICLCVVERLQMDERVIFAELGG